jgi:hypothetical protein
MNGALDGLSEAKPTHGLFTFCHTTVRTPMRPSDEVVAHLPSLPLHR